MNENEKDNIIDLLCTSEIENIELAIILCEGCNVNIEDIIEEYGYNSIEIKTPEDFKKRYFNYIYPHNIKQFPNSVNIMIYGYDGQFINYPNKIKQLGYEDSIIKEIPNSNARELFINNSVIDLLSININTNVEHLWIIKCVIENIDMVLRCFPNLAQLHIMDCKLETLPDISSLTQLYGFRCINCNIEKIDENYKLPDMLNYLNLGHNQLTVFNLISLNNLRTLMLQNNKITEFKTDLNDFKLNALHLSDNPIREIKTTRDVLISISDNS